MPKKLLFQTGVLLATFVITVVVVLGIVVSIGTTTMFLNAKNEMIDRDLFRMRANIQKIPALSAMLGYWKENAESVIGDYTRDELDYEYSDFQWEANFNDVDFNGFSDIARHTLAKDYYRKICNDIDLEMSKLDYKSIYFMDLKDGYVYCSGIRDDSQSNTSLGQQKDVSPSRHPAIKKILSGVYTPSEYEVFKASEGVSLYIGYATIEVGMTQKCAVCVEYDWTSFNKSFTENLVMMLMICLAILILLVVLLLSFLRKRVITPITEMQKCVRQYMATKNSSDVIENMKKVTANNELKLFADDLSELSNEIDNYICEVKRSHEAVKTLTSEVMDALAKAIDAKDEYTNGHSERVAIYSRMIAGNLGLSDEDQEKVYYMGLLHDVGKIGIPKEILNKKTKLTDEELELVRSHPIFGYEILEKIKSEPDLALGARWHHEYYDGTGYPDGKKGEEIPLLIRIITVADCYDAMTSNRTYRKYLTQEAARAEIEKNIGTQFDPDAARCMLQIIDRDRLYALRE